MSLKDHYECHVTYDPVKRDDLKDVASKHGFKVTGLIKGDEVFGDEAVKMYFTTHDNNFVRIKDRMEGLISELQLPWLRKKIERIVYDVRA